MLEGFVRQLILGYLGRYVKDFQKEQLKITLWNEEVFLENVELSLEAFDYLQLPFALREGRVGKLSIKIPWKKLGWDPIVIILEDVFLCASQRDDEEWSSHAVERRELAGKKAKLAAAELTKLSKRVCDNRAGQSFISYITAKILDNIQVSIRSFHFLYRDIQGESVHTMFGLKFSSLTIMKQNPFGSTSSRVKSGLVNKTVDIIGLELYCGTFQGPVDLLAIDNTRLEGKKCDFILAPCDLSMSLLVNRSGELDSNNPQYLINAELTGLKMSLDEVQLQQVLVLWDYLCTSQLREKYGRYRPWSSPLSKKMKGWKLLWWHYAQESVLSDVRKKLKKTSWRYLGQRLSYRRKYVNLYKIKLYFLRQEQSIDANTLGDLEQMEKELDIDDILSYRSVAECELQEVLSNSSTFNLNVNDASVTVEKSRTEDLMGKSRGWFSWLSLGMLGAGGTDDCSQFSGVVSDEVVKDIYEATKFHPLNLSNVDAGTNDKIYLCEIKFSIHQISATLRSLKHNQEIANLILNDAIIECKLWEESATIICCINSGQMLYPCIKKAILCVGRHTNDKLLLNSEHPCCTLQVDVSPNHEVELAVKGMLQPLEVTFDANFFVNFMEFLGVLSSFESQHERVLSSLNRIKNVDVRLLSKAEYILSSRKNVTWDVSISNILINVPWGIEISEQWNLVFEVRELLFSSICDTGPLLADDEEKSYILKNLLDSISNSDLFMGNQFQDLNDHFAVKLNDFEMKIMMPFNSEPVTLVEKFSTSIKLQSFMIPDESIWKQLEVYISVSSLHAQFSPSIYGAVLGLIAYLDTLGPNSDPVYAETFDSCNVTANGPRSPVFGFCVNMKFDKVILLVDLANDEENSTALIFSLQELDMRYFHTEFEEFWICLRAMNIITSPLSGESDSHVLYSSGNDHPFSAMVDIDIGYSNKIDVSDKSISTQACFILHYESLKTELAGQKCTICLNDADVHCYPYIIRLLIGFIQKLSAFDMSGDGEHSFGSSMYDGNKRKDHHFGFQKFGFSNFFEIGSVECASIPLDRFPFITMYNSGSLDNLESSLLYSSPEWRKKISLRDRRIKSPQFSIKKVSKNFHFHASALKSTSGRHSYHASGSLGDNNLSAIDVSLCGIRVHFHDSSCIIGTVTLPSSNCSVCVNENCMDVLCSIEGLILTSSWWTKNLREFLWGAALPNLSPIINVRLRKEKYGSSSCQLEVEFGIQHVYCILPPEYLAIIIGYFSLPDWSSDSKEQSISVGHEKSDAENEYSIVYKFEILDCVLILPVGSIEHQFLKVGIQQLYISFTCRSSLNNVFNGIPPEYLIPKHKLAKSNNCLNIFGRDLFLSLLSYKDDGYGCVRLEKDTGCSNTTFVGPLSVDVWVRIPCARKSSCKSTASATCIIISIANCQVMPDDHHNFNGFEALLDVINQFILVSDDSKCFKSDVLQFLQLRRCLKENSTASPVASSIVFIEVKCYVHSLLLEFYRFRKLSSEVIAKGEMRFLCSASLQNDSVTSFGLSFYSLALFSLPDSVILARCTSTCSNSSALDISFTKLNQGENELDISLPSLDVWLHLSDWFEVIEFFTSYSEQLSRPASSDASLGNLTFDAVDTLGNMEVTVLPSSLHSSSASTCFASDKMKQEDNIFLIVKSENIYVTFHFPILVSKESCRKVQVAEDLMKVPPKVPPNIIEGSGLKYIDVTLHSKGSELLLDGRNVKLKSNIEKLSGIMVLYEDRSVHSWYLFQIFHTCFEAETSNKLMESVHVKVELECDHLDVSLSHHFFNFWHGVPVNLSEAGSSQFPIVGIDLKLRLRKVSFILSDGRWSCSGPLFDILVRNILLHVYVTENNLEGSVTGEIQLSYNNIHKVFWEPFIEPWQFEINMTRKQEMSLNSSAMTNIHLQSRGHLSLNFTESLIECGFRTIEMIKDSWGMLESNDFPESQKLVNSPYMEHKYAGRYAPYVLQNLTSLPLVYHVYKGPVDGFDVSDVKGGKSVQSGASTPLYINDETEDRLLHVRPTHSSDKLSDQISNAHHYISIQLDGTSVPSAPISMDLVGLTYFEVDFSKAYDENGQENRADSRSSFVVPVVFDVSVQRYSKLIRLYSTVILSNATSMPLEVRFDIPFGVSPKILDPVYPGQELPLPLHLAEAGRMRWRPIGNSYLWSEIYNLSNLLSQETKVGFLKSFVCYPVHPSSDPFRCCISVTNISVPGCGGSNMTCHHRRSALNPSNESFSHKLHTLDESSKRFVHQLTLGTPLVVNNYLPKEVSLAIESAGVTRTTFLSEVETFFHHIDPSHDLGMELHIDGFKSSTLKFPRSEAFCMMAKISGAKFSLAEILTFDTDMANGTTYVAVEKMMDAFSGARELFIYVPFLLYNCTGFPLLITESVTEMKGVSCTIPSSYDMVEQIHEEKKDGLSLVSSTGDPHAKNPSSMESSSSSHIISTRDIVNPHKKRILCSLISSNSNENFVEPLSKTNLESQIASVSSSNDRLFRSNSGWASKDSNFIGYEHGKVSACMYSPIPFSTTSEVMVRVSRCHSESYSKDMPNSLWSSPFHLVPPSGSTTVLVPRLSQNAAFVVSVTSSAVSGPLTGRINAITFQPRYVISNACSKDLCYKQKGTDFVFNLRIGEHSHLHWMDSTRELLVSIRYNEPGWRWSGGFLPEHLGDTQVKMRDYVSGSLNIIRVEVQNADVSVGDEKIVGSLHGNSGTNLILLSDDDSGFMPYRVDNFSRERLRIFQQRCEAFETIVHPYTSCPYAWDEPCYPHRLIVEVPGECVLGSYALDDVKENKPVFLPSSSEKPERTLFLSVHAEGATKVLHVIDSSYHILNDMESRSVPLRDKRKLEHKQDKVFGYKEKISVEIPYIGISLINFHTQELLFACARNVTVDLVQSLDQQQLFFQILSLQIDNQLCSSPYPVMLSFDREYKSNPSGFLRAKDDGAKPRSERILQMTTDSSFVPVFILEVSKWRKKDISLVSFQYISLRVADFRLELEQELILSLFDFLKNVSSRFQSGVIPLSDPLMRPLIHDNRSLESLAHVQTSEYLKARGNQFHFKIVPVLNENHHQSLSLPCVIPIGAPWQKIHLLARRHRKIYIEMLDLGPIKLTLSFSSAPWMLRKGILTSGESLIHRGLMAVADVEGARIHLKQLAIVHHIASLESIQEILIRHYTRQLLHEMYKVFGSAGVIGNPMGFARSLGLGIRDFLSVPARSIFQSPTGLITGMAQGTTSLLSNTVYAISDTATQFSRAAHKGIVAFTFDDQTVSRMEHQQMVVASHSKGVINEVLEGLTGLLQSPIKGAEKHGLPGVLSGIALGITGLVARPAASILQVTGKTAQSIRNRSRVYQMGPQRFRIRLPRPLSREFPLRPYSWEEAIGTSVLVDADDGLRLKDEVFVLCKALKQAGKFVIITERLVLIVSCSCLVGLGKPEFRGVPSDLEWVVESEIGLESVIHADYDQEVVHIVGSSSDTLLRDTQQGKRSGGTRTVRWSSPTLPLIQTNLELAYREDAENFLQVLLSTIALGKVRGWGCRYLLHRSGIKNVRSGA